MSSLMLVACFFSFIISFCKVRPSAELTVRHFRVIYTKLLRISYLRHAIFGRCWSQAWPKEEGNCCNVTVFNIMNKD